MLLHIPALLSTKQLDLICRTLDDPAQIRWQSGLRTAGAQAAQRKNNHQVDVASPAFAHLSGLITQALLAHPLHQSAVLPAHLTVPLFNRYSGGEHYGLHVDAAVQRQPQTGHAVRTDVSITVFLSDAQSYDGGELLINDLYGSHEVKLAAGDAIVYPASSLHQVLPVTRGERRAAFLWAQSLVRDPAQRQMLFDLDMAILSLRQKIADDPDIQRLTQLYHNLLRQWAQP